MSHGDPSGSLIRRVAMRIAYDGTDFLGWQRQAAGRTVQGELEGMLARLCGDHPVTVVAAGRTDSGVHASGQVAHADVATQLDDAQMLHALQRMTCDELAVLDLRTVSQGFHARFKAHRRRYRYELLLRPDPFRTRYAWPVNWPLDVEKLEAAALALRGRHDFTALSKHNPDTSNAFCEVVGAAWERTSFGLAFEIEADRFLYGMVRMLVGIQIDVARGRRPLDEIGLTLASRDRSMQSQAAPARGLTLVAIGYPSAHDPFPAESLRNS